MSVHSPFKAKFPGTCRRCHGPIEVGEIIRKSAANGYEHAGDDECEDVDERDYDDGDFLMSQWRDWGDL